MVILNFDNIIVTPLKKIHVEGGDVFHCMKKSNIGFNGFGEAYFSFADYLSIKAWKKHKLMTLNLVVPIGEINFVFYSEDFTRYKSIIIGSSNYSRITVPPGFWFGFQGLSKNGNLLLNLADIEHVPEESDRIDIQNLYYNWK